MEILKQLFHVKTLLVIVVLLSLESLFAQNLKPPIRRPPGRGQYQHQPVGPGTIPDYSEDEEDADTVKKPPKVRKPLESFYFNDSLRQSNIFAWRVSMMNNDITLKDIDTLLPGFQIDYRFMRPDLGGIFLGNIGSAVMPINYFRRSSNTVAPFSFLNVWAPFIKRPEGVKFYNTKTPFSRINFEMSGSKRFEENIFNFVLSHNISPSSTFNIEYNADGTKGHYMHQKTLDRYMQLSFAHTGKRYAVHGGYIYNRGKIDENGGLQDDKDITDTVYSRPREIPVNLETANNTFVGHTFWVTQSYGIPLRRQAEDELTIQKIPTVYAGMSLEITNFKRMYSDQETNNFFANKYINDKKTFDSTAQTMTDVRFFAQLQPYDRDGILGVITGGLGHQTNKYHMDTVPSKYVPEFGNGGAFNTKTTYLYGTLDGAFKKYLRWGANVKYNLVGDYSGDFTIGGKLKASAYIKGRPLTLDASVEFSQQSPDVWVQNFFSNHFAWANSFTRERNTSINARLLMPSIGMEVGGDFQMVQNKIYYDQESMPAQLDENMSVMGLYLQKNFRLGGFRLNHRVLMQWSTNQEVVPVPSFAVYISYSYEFDVVRKVLRLQLGVDGRYTAKYYVPGYNPAISKFYNQREKEIGAYPFLDFYVAAKWKRMRILLKLQHFNEDLFGSRDYFVSLHQPANRLMLKFGFSWTFYD